MVTIGGNPRNGPWSTEDELTFVRNLGSYSEDGKKIDAWRLVERYRDALLKRPSETCCFDKEEVIRAANLRLSGL